MSTGTFTVNFLLYKEKLNHEIDLSDLAPRHSEARVAFNLHAQLDVCNKQDAHTYLFHFIYPFLLGTFRLQLSITIRCRSFVLDDTGSKLDNVNRNSVGIE